MRETRISLTALLFLHVTAKVREGASSLRQHRRGARRAGISKGRRPYRAGAEHRRPRGMVVVRPARPTGNYIFIKRNEKRMEEKSNTELFLSKFSFNINSCRHTLVSLYFNDDMILIYRGSLGDL